MCDELLEAKQKLVDKLGPNYDTYIHLLGQWFRGFISKEEFDEKARQLIDQSLVAEHNKFWLAFFHQCANNTSSSLQSRNLRLKGAVSNKLNTRTSTNECRDNDQTNKQPAQNTKETKFNPNARIKCLPNRLLAQMRIFVIAWEMGINSVNDKVAFFLDLALQQFMKNIITEVICTKTAYRYRENKFKYGFGVRPLNPYLNNSMKVYSANLEYDPYQIEANKMNGSLVDTYAYNDSLFPARLHESQALFEFACSTTSMNSSNNGSKRLKLSEIFLNNIEGSESTNDKSIFCLNEADKVKSQPLNGRNSEHINICNGIGSSDSIVPDKSAQISPRNSNQLRNLSIFHLFIAMLNKKSIIPSHTLYALSLERIVTRLPY